MTKRIFALFMAFVLALSIATGLDLACGKNDIQVEAAADDSIDVSNENFYMLAVSTGATGGDSVEYFAIRYFDENNQKRVEIILPNAGKCREGYTMVDSRLERDGRTSPAEKKAQYAFSHFEISVEPYIRYVGEELRPNTVTEYVFTPAYAIKEVISIEVCASAGDSNWYCAGIGLYRINKLRGIDMVGYFSSTYFVDFEGILIAKATYGNLGIIPGSGITVNFTKDDTNYNGAKLETPMEKYSFAETYALKIDIAQSAEAGLESFLQSAKGRKTLVESFGSKYFKEFLSLHIQYRDNVGLLRDTYIPVCANYLYYLMNEMGAGNSYIFGIGQSSDSIIIPVLLPGMVMDESDEYDSFKAFELAYSADAATQQCHLEYGKGENDWGNAFRRNITEGEIIIGGVQFLNKMPELYVNSALNRVQSNFSEEMVAYYIPFGGATHRINYGDKMIRHDFTRNHGEYSAASSFGISDNSYLIEMDIDSAKGSETLCDIYVQFSYVDTNGIDVTSSEINVNHAVNEFYGNWLTTKGTYDGTGAFQMLSVENGKLRFVASLDDVARFVSVSVKTSTEIDYVRKLNEEVITDPSKEAVLKTTENALKNDDFQLQGIVIKKFKTNGYGALSYTYLDKPLVVNGSETNWQLDRKIDVSETEYAKYVSSQGKGVLIIADSNGETLFFGEVTRVENKDSINWWDYKDSITYAQTKQDFDYTKRRVAYDITVDVPSDKDNDNSVGDSGSKNQFYFMLMFEGGETSAYVLANQQLASDCFNSGHKERFTIYTNYDYGEVTGVRIIPDAQQENADIYDKLKISQIIISKQEKSITKNWICNVNDWVGIDYADDGASVSAKGQTARSEDEIARSYAVNLTSYDTRLLFEIKTGKYGRHDNQPTGCMNAIITYKDVLGAMKTETIDVYERMYAYMNITPEYNTDDNKQIAVINRDTMLKECDSSSFELTLQRAERLVSIKLIPSHATEDTNWCCEGINVMQIVGGTGGLYKKANGVRERDYETILVADTSHDSEKVLLVSKRNASSQYVTFNFDMKGDMTTDIEEDSLDNTQKISDDSLNIYVHLINYMETPMFPNIIREKSGKKDFDMGFRMTYSYNAGRRGVRKSIAQQAVMNYNAENHLFYSSIQANGLLNIANIVLEAREKGEDTRIISGRIYVDYIVIEHVQGDAIVGTYTIDTQQSDITANEDYPWEPRKLSGISSGMSQKVIVAFGKDTEKISLKGIDAEKISDIGVALRYKSQWAKKTGKTNKTYTTPIRYMSRLIEDGNEFEIEPYKFAEMEFTQNYIDEIEGVEIIGFGDVEASISSVSVSEFDNDTDKVTAAYTYYSRNEKTVSQARTMIALSRCYNNKDKDEQKLAAQPTGYLSLTIKTGQSDVLTDGIDGKIPVKAIVSWADGAGINNTFETIEDINDYVVEGKGIVPGESALICIPLQNYASLHSVTLIPYDEDLPAYKTWPLESVSVKLFNIKANTTAEQTRTVNKAVTGYRNTVDDGRIIKRYEYNGGLKMNFAEVSFGGVISYQYTSLEGVVNSRQPEYFTEGMEIRVDSDSTVVLETDSRNNKFSTDNKKFILGSFDDITVTVKEVYGEGANERAEQIKGNITLYTSSGEGYTKIEPDMYSDGNMPIISKIEFTGTSAEEKDVVYLLTLTSKELPDLSVEFRITVAGKPKQEQKEEVVSSGDDLTTEKDYQDGEQDESEKTNSQDESEETVSQETSADTDSDAEANTDIANNEQND